MRPGPYSHRALLLVIAVLGLTTLGHAQSRQGLPTPNACPVVGAGPPPCRDVDGDGFCDSWEIAKRIPGGALLPDADPNKPDIYVWYDWMDYGLNHNTCATDLNCTQSGLGHAGEKCGGLDSQYPGRCTYACQADSDCTSRWPTEVHAGERCIQNACQHTHDPLVAGPDELNAVIARFAQHSINLHILRGQARPHSNVVSFRRNEEMTIGCEGGSLTAGTVGPGQYAVSLNDLKPLAASSQAYHYTLFSHYSGCDSQSHCSAIPANGSTCPSPMAFGQAGLAEQGGNDFVVSLGGIVNKTGVNPHFQIASAFMHELGHNLGLHHGGNEPANYKPNYLSIMNYRYEKSGVVVGNGLNSRVAAGCSTDSECGGDGGTCVQSSPAGGHCSVSARACNTSGECPVDGESCLLPPPRLKVCSRSAYACEVGSDCPSDESCLARTQPGSCARLDYSRQTLPIGGLTPGALDEAHLDDTVGLGSGNTDIFTHGDGRCSSVNKPAGSTGPVNWAGTGVLTTPSGDLIRFGEESFADTDVQADVNALGIECDPDPRDIHTGYTDWPDLSGIPFAYKFQCAAPLNGTRKVERGIAPAEMQSEGP